MHLEDYTHLVHAIRATADALRREADYVQNATHAEVLRHRAAACERRATEMERELPARVADAEVSDPDVSAVWVYPSA